MNTTEREFQTGTVVGTVQCFECGDSHEAEYSHEGRFGEGPIFAVVCTVDYLTSYYTTEGVDFTEGSN